MSTDAEFEVLTSVEDLTSLYPAPHPLAHQKVLSRLDQHCRTFIAHTPLVFIASSDAKGCHDISPRGDAPGFVEVLDDTTLLLPDRMGNNRLDTFRNVLERPGVALIFVVPGFQETLRIEGHADIVTGPGLTHLGARGKTPVAALRVSVREAFLHCAKAFLRSRVWEHGQNGAPADMPRATVMLHDHVKQRESVDALDAMIEESIAKRL